MLLTSPLPSPTTTAAHTGTRQSSQSFRDKVEIRPEYGRNGPRTLGEAPYAERHPVCTLPWLWS